MPFKQLVPPKYPLQKGLPLSSSNNNVVSTCLYKTPDTNLDQCVNGLPSAVSMAHSPRTLYAQYFDSPAINGRGTGVDYRFRKDLNVLTGYDTMKSEEEFDTLQISMQRKPFPNMEQVKFAQSPLSTVPDSFTEDYSQQDSFSQRSWRTSTSSDSDNNQYNHLIESVSLDIPIQRKSIAERRGKQLNHLNPQRKSSLESQQALSQISACSLLSYQPSLLEDFKSEPSTQNEKVQLIVQSPRSLLIDIEKKHGPKKSPTYGDHTTLTKGLLSPFCDRNRSYHHKDSVIGIDIRNENKSSNSLRTFSDSYDSFYWMEDENEENVSLSQDDPHSSMDRVYSSAIHHKKGFSFPKLTPASNKFFEENLASPTMTNILDFLPDNYTHHRPRAHSVLSPIKISRSTRQMYQKNNLLFIDPARLLNKCDRRPEGPSQNNLKPSVSTITLKLVPIQNDSRFKKKVTKSNDSSLDNISSLSEINTCTKEISRSSCPNNDVVFERPAPRKWCTYTSTEESTNTVKKKHQPHHSGTIKPMVVKKIESPMSSGNNQMTLRMTLTRPDLRLDEAKIYAWQDSKLLGQNQNPPRRHDKQILVKGPLGGPDGWGLDEKERGVVKRFWNKVTHNKKVLIS